MPARNQRTNQTSGKRQIRNFVRGAGQEANMGAKYQSQGHKSLGRVIQRKLII